MSKPLYIMVTNNGDGSYGTAYVLDPAVIDKMQEMYDADEVDCESGIGVDGDGFHYDIIQVPDNATEESLDISVIELDDPYFDKD